ncbi:MAG: hypothetical protein IJQ07_01455 [Clostridia bacterium]|nr:hypothetical protein [Clostridia bacterium]
MADEKQKSNFIVRLFALFKSRRARNILYLVLIAFATVSMFLLDEYNFWRDGTEVAPSSFAFLTDNIVSKTLALFGIPRYDVTSGAWCLFIILMTVCLMIVIGHIIAPKFVAKKVADNPTLMGTERKTRTFYNVLYYGVLILIAGVIILISYFAGAFNLYGANPANPFISLLAMMGIFLLFLIALLIVIIIVYLIIRLIMMACAAMFKKNK